MRLELPWLASRQTGLLNQAQMDPILRSIQEDRHAGLHSDASGRAWFRQRRVRFATIQFRPEDLLAGGWGGFSEPLLPLNWEPPPELRDLRQFAAEASRRFLTFWYRCIDVMVARSLFGQDRRIFQVPFFTGSLFSDTGIAQDQRLSAIQPDLHATILSDYTDTLHLKTTHSIHFLSTYLEGITDDLRDALLPLHALWRAEEERLRLLEEPDRLCSLIEQRLLTRGPSGTLAEALLAEVDRRLSRQLDLLYGRLREIPDADLRRLIHRHHLEGSFPLAHRERRMILSAAAATPGESEELTDALDLLELPGTLSRSVRRAFYYATRRLHEATLTLRQPKRATGMERQRAAEERLHSALADLQRLAGNIEGRRLLTRLDRMAEAWESRADMAQSFSSLLLADAGAESTPDSARLLRRLMSLPEELEHVDRNILAHHRDESLVERESALLDSDQRYPPAPFPRQWHPARDERIVLEAARGILNERLRVIRRTASGYSLRPGDRHGILTLNPVLRLWKERSNYERGLPPLLRREINTPDVVQCLIDIAVLADPDLPLRSIQASQWMQERHGTRDLQRMRFFLIPGSCGPVREIDTRDFPEFRNRVIGDERSPNELGIDREEGVLTGAWYRKNAHTLYYPVGGDNPSLLSIVWKAGRINGVAAFFFALGQFVHDCMDDRQIYYRLGEPTFREAIEDYYQAYEKLKKTRDQRSGRRRRDNSRAAIRFMFAVYYSRYLLEALTGTSQASFRHRATEEWFARHTRIPLLTRSDRQRIRDLRADTRHLIQRVHLEVHHDG